MGMGTAEALSNIRGCQWFMCEGILTKNWYELIKVSMNILDIGQVRRLSLREVE